MKAYVITLMNVQESVAVASRCITSGKKHGVDIEHFVAYSPELQNVEFIAAEKGIPTEGFKEVYSRYHRCLAAFLSHHELWEKCVELNENMIIFEHDAIVRDNLPLFTHNLKVMNIGKPSYGKSSVPMKLGRNPLTSKTYFPGAHAYMISPAGARKLILQAKVNAGPTDVFLNLQNFPWLEEYYPWPVEVKDSFTTIQNENGCRAKHHYGEGYGII